jgi:hypothetical protein
MNISSGFGIPGIAFLLTLGSGIWLSSAGKPLHTGIFTIHKLISLGMVIVTAVQIFNVLKNTPVQGFVILLVSMSGLFVLALFASGALMSIGKPSYNAMLLIHRIMPFLLAISLAVTLYVLAGKNQ